MKSMGFLLGAAWLFLGVSTTASAADATQALTVTDFSGRVVSLNKPAKRIIALAPHITENVFFCGGGRFTCGRGEFF